MIADLFDFFLEFPERLPEYYRQQTEADPAHRVVCDYIAGMTDRFCIATFKRGALAWLRK